MSGFYYVTEETKKRKTEVSEDQIAGLVPGNIREAIREEMPNAYDAIFQKLDTSETLPLKNSLGSESVKNNEYYISFSVAGSAYAEPLRAEKDFYGQGDIWVTDAAGNRSNHEYGAAGEVYTYTAQDGKKHTLHGGKEFHDFVLAEMEKTYGHPVGDLYGNGINMNGIREKVSPDLKKVKYSISGPRKSLLLGYVKHSGVENDGDYKIENTECHIETLGMKNIDNLVKSGKFNENSEDIRLSFTGHSRGAVGAIRGAMRLKHLIKEKYPHLAHKIHFNTVLYDPVPGPKTQLKSNVNHTINLKEQTAEMKEAGLDPLDESDHTTVMYSVGCNYGFGFTSMKIFGADTVILTGQSHYSGLSDTEMQNNMRRRKALIDVKTGEAIRASGLANMRKGVFFRDENGFLVEMNDMEKVEKIIAKTRKTRNPLLKDRLRIVTESANELHMRLGGAPSVDCIIRSFNAHDPFYVPSSKEFGDMKKLFKDYSELKKKKNASIDEVSKMQADLKKSALLYLEKKQGNGPFSNRTQGRMQTARAILSLLDHERDKTLQWMSREELATTEKNPDYREAYLENTMRSMEDGLQYLQVISENYAKGHEVNKADLRDTLASLMADNFFLNNKKALMPDPVISPFQKESLDVKLIDILGEGDHSLYDTFRNSEVLNQYVESLEKTKSLDLFTSSTRSIEQIQKLTKAVAEKMAENKQQNKKQEEPTKVNPSNSGPRQI